MSKHKIHSFQRILFKTRIYMCICVKGPQSFLHLPATILLNRVISETNYTITWPPFLECLDCTISFFIVSAEQLSRQIILLKHYFAIGLVPCIFRADHSEVVHCNKTNRSNYCHGSRMNKWSKSDITHYYQINRSEWTACLSETSFNIFYDDVVTNRYPTHCNKEVIDTSAYVCQLWRTLLTRNDRESPCSH